MKYTCQTCLRCLWATQGGTVTRQKVPKCARCCRLERESKHNLVNVESKNGSDSDDHGLDGS